jgi:hypothetical protein
MKHQQQLSCWALCCCLGMLACGKATNTDRPLPSHTAAAGEAGVGGSDTGQGGLGGNGDDHGGAGEGGGITKGDGGASGAGAGGSDGASGAAGDASGAGAGGADPCPDPPLGMVAWWPGEGDASDLVGGSDGRLGQGTSFAPGLVDQAFDLDGVDDYVDFGNASALHVSSADFSVDAWVRFDAVPAADMSIVDKMSAGGVNLDGWRLIKQEDNRFWFCFGGGSVNRCVDPEFTLFSTTLAVPDVWFHVAAVKSASGFSLYVNGEQEDSRSQLPAFVDTHSASLLVGSYILEGSHLDGLVDEVHVFNRALSATEVRSIFSTGKLGNCR